MSRQAPIVATNVPPAPHALAVFRSSSYRRLWAASLLWNQARWMDQIVLGWVVLEMTDSAWHVALVGTLRWLPVALFGIFGGAVADRLDRRRLLVAAQVGGMLVSIAVAVLLATGTFRFEHAVVAGLLLGLQWAVDWPTRRALIPDLVGRELTLSAVVLESISMNITRIIGPLMAGVLLTTFDGATAFGTMAGLYGLEIVLLLGLRIGPRSERIATGTMMRYLAEGWHELRRSEAIVGVLAITAFMNIFAFPHQQLLPVVARDVLAVDAFGLGLLGASAGLGSLAGALILAFRRGLPRAGRLFAIGSFTMCAALVGFATTSHLETALVLLMVSGFGSSTFSAYQSTIILRSASDQLRGRAMGALTVAIGMSPLGVFEMGALTSAVGAPIAIGANAAVCALLIVATTLVLPRFRDAP